jgi:hypothetical protein
VTLLTVKNGCHSPPKSMLQIPAYVDLFDTILQPRMKNNSSTPIYYIQNSDGRLLYPISFTKKVIIDNHSFPTVDNVEEHLVTFYGQNYMHDDPLWN